MDRRFLRPTLAPSRELWYIVGVVFGDGSVYIKKDSPPHFRVELGVTDKEFAKEFFKCLRKIGLNPFLRKNKSKSCKQGFVWNVYANSKIFYKWFKKNEENLKKLILKVSLKFKISFLRGVFDSDGNLYYTKNKKQIGIRIYSTKIKFVNFIRKLMLKMGFKTSLYYEKKGFCSKYVIWLLGGNSEVEKFLNLIQPTISRKGGLSCPTD